jgi:hypothetical protein
VFESSSALCRPPSRSMLCAVSSSLSGSCKLRSACCELRCSPCQGEKGRRGGGEGPAISACPGGGLQIVLLQGGTDLRHRVTGHRVTGSQDCALIPSLHYGTRGRLSSFSLSETHPIPSIPERSSKVASFPHSPFLSSPQMLGLHCRMLYAPCCDTVT